MSSRRDFYPAPDELQDLRLVTHIGDRVEDRLDDIIDLLAAERHAVDFQPADRLADVAADALGECDGIGRGLQSMDDHEPLPCSADSGTEVKVMDLSFVLPCFNQAHALADSILRIQAGLERIERRGEVIVVDFGSTDDSIQIARELEATVISVTDEEPNSAAGLRRLAGREVLAAARGQVIVMNDCRPESVSRWF